MRKRLLIALAAAAMLMLVPTVAWAHNPVLEASVDCNGVISFTATAWRGDGTDASRTNTDIRIFAFVKDDQAHAAEVAHGEFTKDNGFTFSGTFDAPATDKTVVVVALAKVNWGNGASPGPAAVVMVQPKEGCETTTSSSSTSSSSTTSSSSSTSTSTTSTTLPEETTTTQPPQTTVVPTTAPPTTAPGEGELPFTGAGAAPLLLSLGAGLVAAGGAAVLIARRRAAQNG